MGDKTGEILLAQGKITRSQLEEALVVGRRDQLQLDQVLLSAGYVSPADLARALAKKLRLEYVELTERDVDRSLTGLADPKMLRRRKMLPLRVENGRLIVAMSDPTDFYAVDDLRMISGYSITPVVAQEQEIEQVFNRVYALGGDVSRMLEEEAQKPAGSEHGVVELGEDVDAENAPVVRIVGSILQRAAGEGASDIHFEPGAGGLAVRLRVDGVLRKIMDVPPSFQSGVTARLKVLANLDIAERRLPQDGRFSVRLGGRKMDLRAATLPTVFGEKVVLRLLDTASVELDLLKLGFAPGALERYEEVFERPYGAILVTGPTGSGKSTTLHATLNQLNSPERNIITVEDPVEYRLEGINQIQVNQRAGLTFASALRSILRSDPDVVMIGEIRDRETAKISVEAALTGHLVLATLHTNDAPAAITRLTEMGVEPFLTASAVDCVIAQRLARRLCERCKRSTRVGEPILSDLGFPFDSWPGGELAFYEPVGCDRCGGAGYRGRVGIYEMMVVGDEVRSLIVGRGSNSEVSRAVQEAGVLRLKEDGLIKAAQGITTIEEVLRTVV
ncbi:MAG: Flp pilus assembly complex ATPase component TadA [Actinomycetota bacterium]|nr:Flp pilus assembly complex ATPase component TadA [Actinomycetota bacterium]